MKNHKVLRLDDIFVPGVKEQLGQTFGQAANLYAEDWCLAISSPEREGRLGFSSATELHFTDEFKRLVGWDNYQTTHIVPHFLRGEYGLDIYFRKKSTEQKLLLTVPVDSDTPADTVWVSLPVGSDGKAGTPAYSGDSRSPIPMISVHSVGDLLYRRQN